MNVPTVVIVSGSQRELRVDAEASAVADSTATSASQLEMARVYGSTGSDAVHRKCNHI
jgi:hypothetical protein